MKYNPTSFHFVEKRPDQVIDVAPQPKMPKHKFYLTPHCWSAPQPMHECTYDNFIESFSTMPKDYRLFLDTGFITSHELPQEFWNCIVDKHVFITTEVWKELQPWVANPFCNRWFRDYLVQAIEMETSGCGHSRLSLTSFSDLLPKYARVARYYVQLLWLRKFVGEYHIAEFAKQHGREPTAEENQAHLQQIVGARGWRLAKKAIANRDKPNLNTDESLVVSAAFHSVLFGKNTVTLTRDNDVFEQFYKVIYLIDTHYLSMRLAEEYHKSPTAFKTQPLPDGISLYQGEQNFGISFGEGKSLYDLRSWDTDSIQASCNLLSTSDKPLVQTGRTFGVVADMARIVEIKSRTNGRNTDLFGTQNMHIQLDPRKRCFETSGPALINDRLLEGRLEDDIPITAVDSDFAIFTNEGFMRLEPAGTDDE